MNLDLYRLATEATAGERLPMMLFPLGTFKSAKYAKLPLTRELADELIANFEAGVLGTEPVVDSSGRHDESTQAAGWVKRLYVAETTDGGQALFADWEPTDLGAALLNEKRYRYNSVHIDAHTDNVTGAVTPRVLKGVSLTNTPVLRIMPAVLDAQDAIAASEVLEYALSELEPDTDPVAAILDDMDALATKLDEALKGKRGMPSMRTLLREVRSKASAYKMADESYTQLREALEAALETHLGTRAWVEDFGDDWLIYTESSVEEQSRIWRAPYSRSESGVTFGTPAEVERQTTYVPKSPPAAGEKPATTSPSATVEPLDDSAVGLADGGGVHGAKEHEMSKLTELLKLSEGADQALIDSAVLALAEKAATADAEKARADAAEAKLAEGAKAERIRSLEAAVEATEVLPAEKDGLLALAESAPQTFDALITARKGLKLVDLAEHGSGAPSQSAFADASVELATKAKARAIKDGTTYAAAETLVLSENENGIRERYADFRMNKEA